MKRGKSAVIKSSPNYPQAYPWPIVLLYDLRLGVNSPALVVKVVDIFCLSRQCISRNVGIEGYGKLVSV